MSNPLSGYAAIAKHAQNLLKERDVEIASLKAQLESAQGDWKKLYKELQEKSAECDRNAEKAEYWEQEYRSLERDYYRRP